MAGTTDDSGQDLYLLDVAVTDGDPAGPDSARRVGVRDVRVMVADVEIASASSDASCTHSCQILMKDIEFDTDAVDEGEHEVKIVAFDRLNHRSEVVWKINVIRDTYYGNKLRAWHSDVENRVDQANPLPLSERMPVPPAHWEDPVSCEQDTVHLGACFDANQAWGQDVTTWLQRNPMLTAKFSSLPRPPTFEYARARTARELTRGMRAAFEAAEPLTEDLPRLLRVVLGFHEPLSRSQVLTLLPAIDLQSGVEFRGVFDPAGRAITVGYRSANPIGLTPPLPLGGHLDAFYKEQLDQNVIDVAEFEQEIGGEADGDPADSDDIAALQDALDGERELQSVLQAKGALISGITVDMTLAALRTLLATFTAPIKGLRIIDGASTERGEDALSEMATDAEVVTHAAEGDSLAPTARALAPAGVKKTCAQLDQETDDTSPTFNAPNSIAYKVRHYGYPAAEDPKGLVRKRASMSFRFTGDNLAWFCGDDSHDRGLEPETKVQRTDGPRWGVDQQNYGWRATCQVRTSMT